MSSLANENFILQLAEENYSLPEIFAMHSADMMREIDGEVINFIQTWHDDKAYVYQKTSGSTGPPKNIKILKQQMTASAEATMQALSLGDGDKALLNIHPDYIGGKMMIVRALTHGLTLVVAEVSANPMAQLPSDEAIDFFSFVPYQLQQILNNTPERIAQLNQAKAIIIGGAAVPESLHSLIKEHISSSCYSTYGMTETVSHIALKQLNRNKSSNEEPFRAIQGVTFSVDHDNRLIIHAPLITGQQDLLTNDVVKLLSPTTFEWLGRHDFVINSGGIKIHAEQLEKEIASIFDSASVQNSFFVFGKAHKQWGEQLTLMIEGDRPSHELGELLKALPKTKRPKEIYFLDRFLYTKNDKLDRLACIKSALA